ncbi:MAG: DUF4258 domain-containing protein [Ruminococcaceae bacterium]|nr:DUF4258 domain-containing protein [Oscillospiraceae bacterium]
MYIQENDDKYVFSPKIEEKLSGRSISKREIDQCFANRTGKFLIDEREEHKTHPPSNWFISETNKGRVLKIVFIVKDEKVHIKTAFEPSDRAKNVYDKLAYK